MASIRLCRPDERAAIAGIINAAAEAYRGIIPADRWHDPSLQLLSAHIGTDAHNGALDLWTPTLVA